MRHALSDILRDNHLADPDLSGKIITVTEVRISPDLRNATAFVLPLGGTETDKTVQALNRAAGYFRGELGRAVKMQFTPTLRFRADETFEEASRIEKLLHDPVVARDLHKDDDAKDGDDEA
jgi:ribosome-binding factor A